VFETFGSLVLHVGPLGAGEILKLVNNYLFTAQISVADGAVRLLESLGLDVRRSMTAIASSTGSSRCIQMFVEAEADHVFPRHKEGRARGAELLGKDIGLFDAVLAGRELSFLEPLDLTVRTGLEIAEASGVGDG
jgi:3-hydroxyisobutyrate dehydrogenase-like beta-hydroxyacid dehydrogenase